MKLILFPQIPVILSEELGTFYFLKRQFLKKFFSEAFHFSNFFIRLTF